MNQHLYAPAASKAVFFNPSNFQADQFVKKGWIPAAQYFVHKIYTFRPFNCRAKTDWVNLKAEYLRKIMPKLHYRAVINALIDGGVVVCNHDFQRGRYSKGFRLTEKYADEKHKAIICTNKAIVRKINDHKKDKLKGCREEARLHLYKNLFKLQVSLFPGDALPLPLDAIKLGHFHFGLKDEFGHRLHTNLTNLKREYRQFISVNNKPLVSVDIKNSQPLFLSIVLLNHYQNNNNHLQSINCFSLNNNISFSSSPLPAPLRCPLLDRLEDVKRFIRLTEEGRLYEELMAYVGDYDRDKFKDRFFGKILYCQNKTRDELTTVFEQEFPNVLKVIRHYKSKDYTHLSRQIQREESFLVIDRVIRRFMLSQPDAFVSTVHDCVLCHEEFAQQIIELIRDEFRVKGVTPSLKAERW